MMKTTAMEKGRGDTRSENVEPGLIRKWRSQGAVVVAHILPTPTRYKFRSHPISFAA